MNYVFHPAAEAEYLESVVFFESKRLGLGAPYLAEFEKNLVQVCESSQQYPIEQKPDVRRIQMTRFPYTILYRETLGTITRFAFISNISNVRF